MNKHRLSNVASLLMAGALVFLAGCSSTAPTASGSALASDAPTGLTPQHAISVAWTPTTKVSPITLSDSRMEELRVSFLDGERESFGLPAMDYPNLVRYVQPDEIASVMVPCFKAKGFVVTPRADGSGWTNSVDPSQDKAFGRAEVECYALYTPDPRASLPPTTDQKKVIYEYYSQFVIPCVRKHGLSIPDLPSEAVWVADPQILSGYPFQNEQILKACPINYPMSAYLGTD